MNLADNSYVSLIRYSWRYAWGEKKTLVLTYLCFVISNICVSVSPLILGNLINKIQLDNTKVFHYIWIYVIVTLSLYLFQYLFHGPGRYLERKLAFNIGRNFSEDIYGKLTNLDMAWHKKNHSGETIDKITKSTHALRDFFQNGFSYIRTFTQFVIALVAIVYFSPLFGLISVGILLIGLRLILLFDHHIIESIREINAGEHKVCSSLSDNLSNILTIISLRLEKQSTQDLLKKINLVYPAFRKNVVTTEWKWFSVGMFINLIYCTLIIAYVYKNYHSNGIFYIGGLVALIGFINQLTGAYFNFANQYNIIIQYNFNVKTVDEILSTKTFTSTENIGASLPKNWSSIRIENLSFDYLWVESQPKDKGSAMEPGLPYHSLYNINLTLKKGQKIALIGASGSGKSSLMSLLKGLYQPMTKVNISVDDDFTPQWKSLSDHITLFPQQPELFENTIKYNLTLGLPYSDDEIFRACELVKFSEVLAGLPAGLSSEIFEDGVNLSGGQKQRLALARGVLACKNSDIILLDEPTSNVDQRTELEIYRQLFREFEGKVVISSIHRLHLLDMFDYIYVLRNGRIFSEGTFAQLKGLSILSSGFLELEQV